VVGVVVQPGVEFGDDFVFDYDREKARPLTDKLRQYPRLVFEGHSTDYQMRENLRKMVEDGIAILKVGPALTFGLREALLALSDMEKELLGDRASDFPDALKRAMADNPGNWRSHYRHALTDRALDAALIYSYLDRCRYYMPEEQVNRALKRMLKNLGDLTLPMGMISRHLPNQYRKIRQGLLKNEAVALLKDRVKDCIADYEFASYG
ncbi:MAG: class II D-tagatose-bisphosphate aldolase, non-catalytic subunit, partial [Clostridiales Family XIII bacterium]|nr:class II D-tagatose-bisphosphate aldolase, non-catalytic subunit [Clostridiales Family XIII bacterium]